MTRRSPDRPPRLSASSGPPSRFSPKAFLAATPATVQRLCEELAGESSRRFVDLSGMPWTVVGDSIVADLRASGHDLISLDDSDGVREWQTTWYHPRGTFSLLLSFRAPRSVEVSWQADDTTFIARA